MSKERKRASRLKTQKDQLLFNGNFESGNIGSATQVSPFEYEITVRPDTLNPRHRLWFHFSVSGAHSGQKVLFTITNFSKTRSLYRNGMAPVVRSLKRPVWFRMPESHAFYYRPPKNKKQYHLSFIFEFDDEEDTYYFAYCFPYSYTRIQRLLSGYESKGHPYFHRALLCRTVLGRRIDLLTITSPESEETTPLRERKIVVVTARVHPGETPASWVCQGFLDFILGGSDPRAQLLRDHIVFKVVPCLNPDGVFLGNYRGNSLGFDLNRFWLNPHPSWMPSIHAVRQLLIDLDARISPDGSKSPHGVLDFFMDMHAHSTGMDAFCYLNIPAEPDRRERTMWFPRLLAVNARSFSATSSKFCKDPNKSGSGRRAIGDFLGLEAYCYTLETSFFGYYGEKMRTVPFDEKSLHELGSEIAITLIDFYKLYSRVRKVGASQ
eukprot:TRINITY_DN15514_c0_g1_i1.p1 TRINITY_DN15514_c0_g1~~TRINITY_DN15514_c0_g1_i1.p1  ORF type:complete len:436 (+),score=63.39 TRINITY_DN15514_c0_g1_i1:75-1382(+)